MREAALLLKEHGSASIGAPPSERIRECAFRSKLATDDAAAEATRVTRPTRLSEMLLLSPPGEPWLGEVRATPLPLCGPPVPARSSPCLRSLLRPPQLSCFPTVA